MKFEGIKIYKLNIGKFRKGAAVTIPGIGIFVGKGFENNTELLRHEFGHILQYRKWGFWLFWKHIAPTSLKSAGRRKNEIGTHMDTWTEWSANRLAYDYFKKPADWDLLKFPLSPLTHNRFSKPKFSADNEEFTRDWIET